MSILLSEQREYLRIAVVMLLNLVVPTEKGKSAYILLSIIYVELAWPRYFTEGLQKGISLKRLQFKEATNRCRSRDGRQ